MDSLYDSAVDTPLATFPAYVRWPNATLLRKVVLDNSGAFEFPVGMYPGKTFSFFLGDGRKIGKLVPNVDGNARMDVPLPTPAGVLSGYVWYDDNRNGVLDPGESPVMNTLVDLTLPNRTLLGRVKTDSRGRFNLVTVGYTVPNTTVEVSVAATGATLQTFTTDDSGMGEGQVPIPPPFGEISGKIYMDFDNDRNFTVGDQPLALTTLQIRWPNGSLLASVQTDDAGEFFFPTRIYPNVKFGVFTTSGQFLKPLLTDAKGNGHADIPLPGVAAKLSAQVYYDMDGNKVFDPALDLPVAKAKMLVKFANGTSLQSVHTDLLGTFDALTIGKIYPNTRFSVEMPSGRILGSIATDASGNGQASIPLPPAVIQGTVWWDADPDFLQGSEEISLADSFIEIHFNNGSTLARVPTNATGGFSLRTLPFPNQEFQIVGPDSMGLIAEFSTDPQGFAIVPIPIPLVTSSRTTASESATRTASATTSATLTATPSSTSATKSATSTPVLARIVVDVFLDANNNGIRDPGELGYANQPVLLRLANGTVTVVTNSTGGFAIEVPRMPFMASVASVVGPNGGTVFKDFTTDRDGNAFVPIPLPPPPVPNATIVGTVFWDLLRDNIRDPSEPPYSGDSPVYITFPNGSVLGIVTLTPNGDFSYVGPPAPLSPLQITMDGKVLKQFVTDPVGNATVPIPLPPAILRGRVCLDAASDEACDSSDLPAIPSSVTIRWPNGSVLASGPTDASSGTYFFPVVPYPNQPLTVQGPDGGPVIVFATDNNGNAVADVPLAPGTPTQTTQTSTSLSSPETKTASQTATASQTQSRSSTSTTTALPLRATIAGWVCLSSDGTCVQGTNEPVPNSQVTIRFSNGTVFAVLPTNSSGGFSISVLPPIPESVFYIQGPTGSQPRTFTTDKLGNAFIPVPIPPPLRSSTTASPTSTSRSMTSSTTVATTTAAFLPVPDKVEPTSTTSITSTSVSESRTSSITSSAAPTTTSTTSQSQTTSTSLTISETTTSSLSATSSTDSKTSSTATTTSESKTSSSISLTRTSTATPMATISGHVCLDLGRDGVCDPSDPPVASAPVIVTFPNGSVLVTSATNATGSFAFVGTAYPNQSFVVEGPVGAPVSTMITDGSGTGYAEIPIQKPLITGSLFWDMDFSNVRNPGDIPEAGAKLQALLPNGTIYGNLTTSPNGTFLFEPTNSAPNTEVTLVWLKNGTVTPLGNFTTDPAGNGNIDVPLTPALVQGICFYDLNQNGIQDPTDPPLNGSSVALVLPNSTVWAVVPVDESGSFNYPTLPYPEQPFSVALKAGGSAIVGFLTDSLGNAFAPVPIPPPIITTTIYFDNNNNSVFEPILGDALAGNRSVELLIAPSALVRRWALGKRDDEREGRQNGTNSGGGEKTEGNDSDESSSNRTDPTEGGQTMSNSTVSYALFTSDATGNSTYLPPIDQIRPNATVFAIERESGIVVRFVLDEFGSGHVDIPIPPTKPVIRGTICLDINRDRNCTSGTDQPFKVRPVRLVFPNGTVYAQTTILPDGTFDFPINISAPNTTLDVVTVNELNGTVGSLTTDQNGNALAIFPLDPPSILVRTFADLDRDGNFTAGDAWLDGMDVLVFLPNGTLYRNVTTASNGSVIFYPQVPVEGLILSAALVTNATNLLVSNLTDWLGNGQLDVPIPPPAVLGVIFYDADGNTRKAPSEYPYANRPIQFRLTNGTILADSATGPAGEFHYNTTFLPPKEVILVTTPDGALLGTFKVNTPGNDVVVEIPLIIAGLPGTELAIADDSGPLFLLPPGAVCANRPVALVVGSILSRGVCARVMQVDFVPGTFYQAGSMKAPRDWSIEFSIDGGGNWTRTEPIPSDLVTNIRALSAGDISAGQQVNVTGNAEQEYSAVATAAASSGSVASAASGGDNWSQIFATAIGKFFVYYHHATFIGLDCRIISTGAVWLVPFRPRLSVESDPLSPPQ